MIKALWLLAAIACPGCSLFLDFSNQAAPVDGHIDGPYTTDECAYKEPNDTVATAAIVTPADMGPAAICAPASDAAGAEDDDYYRFTVATATTVTIAISFTERVGGDLDLRLLDTNGGMIAESRSLGDGEMITCPSSTTPVCPTLAAADYVFEVFPGEAGDVNSYTFALTIQ